jgi:hypothetical protein
MLTHQHQILAVLATVVIILWYNSLREQYYVRKRALVHPKFSPWTRLLNLGDEGSFITLTGFNFASFRLMVDILNPTVVEASNTAGRPSALDFFGTIGSFSFLLQQQSQNQTSAHAVWSCSIDMLKSNYKYAVLGLQSSFPTPRQQNILSVI